MRTSDDLKLALTLTTQYANQTQHELHALYTEDKLESLASAFSGVGDDDDGGGGNGYDGGSCNDDGSNVRGTREVYIDDDVAPSETTSNDVSSLEKDEDDDDDYADVDDDDDEDCYDDDDDEAAIIANHDNDDEQQQQQNHESGANTNCRYLRCCVATIAASSCSSCSNNRCPPKPWFGHTIRTIEQEIEKMRQLEEQLDGLRMDKLSHDLDLLQIRHQVNLLRLRRSRSKRNHSVRGLHASLWNNPGGRKRAAAGGSSSSCSSSVSSGNSTVSLSSESTASSTDSKKLDAMLERRMLAERNSLQTTLRLNRLSRRVKRVSELIGQRIALLQTEIEGLCDCVIASLNRHCLAIENFWAHEDHVEDDEDNGGGNDEGELQLSDHDDDHDHHHGWEEEMTTETAADDEKEKHKGKKKKQRQDCSNDRYAITTTAFSPVDNKKKLYLYPLSD